MLALTEAEWLAPVDDVAPAGPNLEFDPDFGALERSAQGEPERQAGDTLVAAKEPDWRSVEAQATALMQRTRDLRVLGHLAVARLHVAGLPAYAEVLGVVRLLLETRWEELHPQLDPEDDNDPTMRATSLLRLADPVLVLRHLRDLPLARSPRLGRFSWRDISLALGAISDDTRPEKPTEAQVRSAFQDSDPAFPLAMRSAAVAATEAVAAIPQAFDAKAGVGSGPNFADLTKLLGEIIRFIDRYAVVPAGELAEPAAEETAGGTAGRAPAVAGPRTSGGVTASALTEVSNRADALRLLDLACQYYRRYEPSSPLPLLIERAQRLAEKNFLEILRDLAPDGVMQAQNIVSGRDE